VHRDVKPDNILIGLDRRARLTDFGLAHIGDADHASQPAAGAAGAAMFDAPRTLTRTGAIMGTPAYMAPEQLARGETDPRTDQWSFCATLYEALAGVQPFVDELAARSAAAIEGRLACRPGCARS
jgi:serine/threonine protein kinase